MKKIFVLGAGFSKDIENIPTLTELSNEIQKKYDSLPEHISNYLRKQIPANLHNNTENLLTYLLSDLPWADVVDTYTRKAVFSAVSNILNETIVEYEKKVQPENESVKKLIAYWHQHESEIISFNYDILVELYSQDLKRKFVPCARSLFPENRMSAELSRIDGAQSSFYYDIDRNYFLINLAIGSYIDVSKGHLLDWKIHYKSSNGDTIPSNKAEEIMNKLIIREDVWKKLNQKINIKDIYKASLTHLSSREGGTVLGADNLSSYSLYKLHGSTNWYYSGLLEARNEPIYWDHSLGKQEIREKEGLTSVIIPPILDKKDFYKNLSLSIQWKKALSAMQSDETDEVYFVGYSLPPTDLMVRNLFSRAFIGKKIKVFIVNKLKEQYQKDLIKNYLLVLTSLSGDELSESAEKLISEKERMIEGITFNVGFLDSDFKTSTVGKLAAHLTE